MAKLTEAASLRIVHDNLQPELCPKKSGPKKSRPKKSRQVSPPLVTSSRSNKLALYFEPSSLDKSYIKPSYLTKSHSLQSPSLQRIYRWMSVKGDHI
jgi:hypothetical protein